MHRKYPGWVSCLKEWMCPPGSLAKESGALWASVKRQREGFVILYGQWDMAKCLSRNTLGHFCSTNKWDTHARPHTRTHTQLPYIHKCRQARTAQGKTHSFQSSNPHLLFWLGLLWTPSWQTKFESKREQREDEKGEENRQKEKPFPLPHSSSHHWLMAQGLLFPFFC